MEISRPTPFDVDSLTLFPVCVQPFGMGLSGFRGAAGQTHEKNRVPAGIAFEERLSRGSGRERRARGEKGLDGGLAERNRVENARLGGPPLCAPALGARAAIGRASPRALSRRRAYSPRAVSTRPADSPAPADRPGTRKAPAGAADKHDPSLRSSVCLGCRVFWWFPVLTG